MKVLSVYTKEDRNSISICAECKIRRVGTDTVYFKFPKKFKPYLVSDASPFVAALLYPAMKQGEDIIVNGTISKQLLDGMYKIMHIALSWNIGLHPIKIIAEKVEEDTGKPELVATFFSGGVDSFYTWLKHKNDRNNPVTAMICVNGYDIDLRNNKLWDSTIKIIRNIAKEEKAELIEAESNIHPLLEPILPWDYTHGGCLAAVALCLRNGIKLTYVPSSDTAEGQIPWGTHMDTDKYWGTEKIKFIHDGTEARRVDKVVWQVSKSPVALKYLRVCYKNKAGCYNCGVCEKCNRTMLNLYIAGVLDKAKTFPHKINVEAIANMHIPASADIYYRENLHELEKLSLNPELQSAIRQSLNNITSEDTSKMKKIINKIVYLDHAYTYGILYKIGAHYWGQKF